MDDTKVKTVTVIGELTTLAGTFKVLRIQPLVGFASNVTGFIVTQNSHKYIENGRYINDVPTLIATTAFSMHYYNETEEIFVLDLDPTLPENEFAIDVPELNESEWEHILNQNGELSNENAQDEF